MRMIVKVSIARDGLKADESPVHAEVVKDEPVQAEEEHYYDAAVVLFALMLQKAKE